MPLPANSTGSKCFRDEYADFADYYLLKLVVHDTDGGGGNRNHWSEQAFVKFFGQSATLRFAGDEMWELMRLRLDELEPAPRIRKGCLFENLEFLGVRLGLGPVAQEILAFRVLVRTCGVLEGFLQGRGALTESRLARILSLALDRDTSEIEEALDASGPLIGSGLVDLDQTLRPFLEKLSLVPGLPNALLKRHDSLESLISFAIKRAEPAALGVEDYTHLGSELELMWRYLGAAVERDLPRVNILLHGPPGVGKTQLARLVSKQAGLILYEIAPTGIYGEPLTPGDRFQTYSFSQRIFGRGKNAAILFDEAEDALLTRATFAPLSGLEKRLGKAWVNQLLEKDPVPAFWLANSVRFIEPAILRRFDYVLEMRNPPRSVRRRILSKAFEGLDAPDPWRDQWAEDEQLSPALAERAARVVRTAGVNDGEAARKQFHRIVESSLAAQGKGLSPRYPLPDNYDLELVNASANVQTLCRKLADRGKGRLLLHGPPGSGKTAFAHYLARKWNRPLHLRRASDLISPWLGETERNIARMFRDAAAENAVLLLDEADSFLQDRQLAVRAWEVTEVNELLTQMECFEGVFLCVTNFRERLDGAALRRFGLKIRFDYLDAEQVWTLFARTLTDSERSSAAVHDAIQAKRELSLLRNLTPGDFLAARQRLEMTGDTVSAEELLEALREESRLKPDGNRQSIGFVNRN